MLYLAFVAGPANTLVEKTDRLTYLSIYLLSNNWAPETSTLSTSFAADQSSVLHMQSCVRSTVRRGPLAWMFVQWQEVLAMCSAHECALQQLSSSMIKIGCGMIHRVKWDWGLLWNKGNLWIFHSKEWNSNSELYYTGVQFLLNELVI